MNFLAVHKFHMYVGKVLNVFHLLRNRCNPSETTRHLLWVKKKRSVKKNLKANECQCWQENLPSLICSYCWVSTSNFWMHVISPVKETKLEISVSNFASLLRCRFQGLFGRNWVQKLLDQLQWYKINMFKGFQFSLVQFSHSVVSDSAIPWIAAYQASLSITNSRSSLKGFIYIQMTPVCFWHNLKYFFLI